MSTIDAQELVEVVNRTAVDLYHCHDTCISSAAAIVDILGAHDIEARVLRVEAAVFPPSGHPPGLYGSVLGSEGDGSRHPAAGPGMWHGHVCALTAESWLLDSTLDQVCYGQSAITAVTIGPVAAHIPDHFLDVPDGWGPRVALNIEQPDGWRVRYFTARRQVGWKHAGAFRPGQRRELVTRVLAELERRHLKIVLAP